MFNFRIWLQSSKVISIQNKRSFTFLHTFLYFLTIPFKVEVFRKIGCPKNKVVTHPGSVLGSIYKPRQNWMFWALGSWVHLHAEELQLWIASSYGIREDLVIGCHSCQSPKLSHFIYYFIILSYFSYLCFLLQSTIESCVCALLLRQHQVATSVFFKNNFPFHFTIQI